MLFISQKYQKVKLMMIVLFVLASGFSPTQFPNYGTTPRVIKSWRWNDCIYTLFEVDGHEYLQVMVRPSNAISLVHHAGCPCMKR